MSEIQAVSISDALRRALAEMTQAKAARLASVNVNTVNRFALGRGVSLSTADKLAAALGVSAAGGGTFKAALKQAIASSDLSQNEIGRRAGLPAGGISRFMRDKQGISLRAADSVATLLGVSARRAQQGHGVP